MRTSRSLFTRSAEANSKVLADLAGQCLRSKSSEAATSTNALNQEVTQSCVFQSDLVAPLSSSQPGYHSSHVVCQSTPADRVFVKQAILAHLSAAAFGLHVHEIVHGKACNADFTSSTSSNAVIETSMIRSRRII